MEVATLGLKVDGSPVDKASTSLDRFTKSADNAEHAATDMGRGVDRAGKRAEARLARVDRGAQAVAGSFRLVTAALAAAATGFGVGRLVSETAAFEQSLLGLQVVSGATAAQMRELEDQSRALGATSMFSAQQAADAQNFLAMAGFNVNETLSATPGILELAAAGSLDLATAADLASNVLGGFRLEAEELARVNDVLASAAANSNTNIQQLGQALSFAAPIAAAAGVSIEETAAAVGVLSDAGLQGSRAGTGLLGVIRQLSNLTPAATEALGSYGLTADEVNIETEGLATVLERLRNANINAADSFKIFGSEAGPAAQILASGAVRVNEFTGELELAEGAAQRAALILGSGLTGSMRSFGSAVAEASLQLGRDSGLSAALADVIDSATGVISVYNGMLPQFVEANNLTDRQANNLQTMAGALSTTASVAGGAAAAYAAYRTAIVAATVAQWAFNTAVSANPLGAFITVAGAATGAIYAFREELGLVDYAAQTAAAAIDDSTRAIKSGSRAALDSSYESLVLSLQEVSLQAQEAQLQLQELQAREQFYAKSHGGVADSVSGAIEQQEAAYQGLIERQISLQAQMEANRSRRESLTASEQEGTETMETMVVTADRLAESTIGVAKSQREAQVETDRFESSVQSLMDTLFPLQANLREYQEEQVLLNQAYDQGLISLDQYTEGMKRLREERLLSEDRPDQAYDILSGPTGMGQGDDPDQSSWDQWLESAQTAFTDFDSMAASTAENFQRGFGDAFESMIFDSQSFRESMFNLFDGIARSLVSALGEMAAQWVAYQAVQATLGQTAQAASAASAAATGTAIAAAYAPAAAMASLASFGANAAPAAAGIASTTALSQSLASAGRFAGLFDNGGTIPAGQWGIAGERGPEIIQGPANITSRRDTADIMNGAQGGMPVDVRVTNNGEPKRAHARSRTEEGRLIIDIMLEDLAGDGRYARALQSGTNVQRRGR